MLKEKHPFLFLYPLLKSNTYGSVNSNILVNEENFAANLQLDALDQFNSYRFAHNHKIIKRGLLYFDLNLSTKIKNAGTSLKNKDEFSTDFNKDFVLLIYPISN